MSHLLRAISAHDTPNVGRKRRREKETDERGKTKTKTRKEEKIIRMARNLRNIDYIYYVRNEEKKLGEQGIHKINKKQKK